MSLYMTFAMSSAGFLLHSLAINGTDLAGPRMSLDCMAWMALANFLGAALYATRVDRVWSWCEIKLC